LHLHSAGVVVASLIFLLTTICCVRCLCQRQSSTARWLTYISIIVVVVSMAAALATGIVGSYYWMQYKLVSKGNTYSDVATTASPSDFDDASIIYFASVSPLHRNRSFFYLFFSSYFDSNEHRAPMSIQWTPPPTMVVVPVHV
jgi:hypothetical protein